MVKALVFKELSTIMFKKEHEIPKIFSEILSLEHGDD